MTDARHLIAALGGRWHGASGNAPCPVCQPERRRDQDALSLRNHGRRLLAHCHKRGCPFADIIAAAGLPPDALRPDTEAPARFDAKRAADEARRDGQAKNIWAEALPIHGTLAETYLRHRGITCADAVPRRGHHPPRRGLAAGTE